MSDDQGTPKTKKIYIRAHKINYIEPYIDEVERFVSANFAKVNCATGSISIETDPEKQTEYKPLKIKSLVNRIRFASEFPPDLPNQFDRVATAIEMYQERVRARALKAIKDDLLLDSDRGSRGNTNLEPLRKIMACGVLPDARANERVFDQIVRVQAHSMQNTLRKLMGLRDRDVMSTMLHGEVGGTGKTEFMRNFFQPVWGDFYFESAFDRLFEKFGFMPWTNYYVLMGDEMSVSGSGQDRVVAIAEIKRTMSCETLDNRGMQTEDCLGYSRRATLFGTCNPHPATIVGDENSRRFYPIPFTDLVFNELKHNLVEDVRPELVKEAWRGIDPFAPSYAAGIKGEIRELQAETMRRKDWVDEVIEAVVRPGDPSLKTLLVDLSTACKNYKQFHSVSGRVPAQAELAKRLNNVYKVESKRSGAQGEWCIHGHQVTHKFE